MFLLCAAALLLTLSVSVRGIVDERPIATTDSNTNSDNEKSDASVVTTTTTTTTTTATTSDEAVENDENDENNENNKNSKFSTLRRSLLDWQFVLGTAVVFGALAIFRVLRQRNEQLAMAWIANLSPVFDSAFAHFPPSDIASHGAYANALEKISDSEFRLRATGRQLAKGAIIRVSLARLFDPAHALLGLGPRFNSCTINILLDSDRFAKYEFGFVRVSHEAEIRARFPALPPSHTVGSRPPRLPAEFVPIGDRNSAMLFESLFATDLVHLLQPGRMDAISYFYITDRYPSPDHQVVATLCVAMPDGLDVQRKEAWEAQQIAVMVAINAASRAANGDVARPVNLIRNTATFVAGAAPRTKHDGSASTDDDSSAASSSAASSSGFVDAKSQRQQQLELAAQERKEAKLRQQREALANNPSELEKFEAKLAKKKQRRAIKIVRQ